MYPELLLVDTTYKLNNLRIPVIIQLIVDGNTVVILQRDIIRSYLRRTNDSCGYCAPTIMTTFDNTTAMSFL